MKRSPLRTSSLAIHRTCAVVALLLMVSSLCGQVQPNSPGATLTVNGTFGTVPLPRGSTISCLVSGAPNVAILMAAGDLMVPGLSTPYGIYNLGAYRGTILDGIHYPSHATDVTGQYSASWGVPWFAPLGQQLTLQAALQDPTSANGFTLSAPTTGTVSVPTLGGLQLEFDPTTSAKGVDSILPVAGTQPGDLPLRDQYGNLGPTGVFSGGNPVHGVFKDPFYCYSCHGQVQEIWPTYMGTMMANAARDPMFQGQFTIAVAGYEAMAQVGLLPAGGELAADFCIRCHMPNAWQGGRSGFEGDGVTTPYQPGVFDHMHSLDSEAIFCDVCHRTTGFGTNITPTAAAAPGYPDSAQMIFSQSLTKRGPYPGTVAVTHVGGTTPYGAHIGPVSLTNQPAVAHLPPGQPGTAVSSGHDTEYSANMIEAEFCGTCHNITNPVNGFPVERTYSEWKNSDYGDPANADFKTCQDCHMPAQANLASCSQGGTNSTYGAYGKVRSALSKHEFVGGNAWIPQILKQMYPMVDQHWTNGQNYQGAFFFGPGSRNAAYDATTANAIQQLKSAAEVDLTATETTPGTIDATVRVTNLSGHKLPTGYSEGRRMWIRIDALDANDVPFFQSGLLDTDSELIHDAHLKVYEAEQGLDYPQLGLSGPSFHFALNNAIYKDNRIPPKGAVLIRQPGGTDAYDPVLAPWPTGGLYPNNQHWDDTVYSITVPSGTARPIKVTTTIYYQTSSYAYVNFLANGGDNILQTMPHPDAVALKTLWDNGFPAPAIPVGIVGPTSTADPASPHAGQSAMVIIP